MPSSNDEEERDSMPEAQDRNREDSNSKEDNVEKQKEQRRNRNEDRFEKGNTLKKKKRAFQSLNGRRKIPIPMCMMVIMKKKQHYD